ncbi:hypothetical protein Hamer_G003299 [Homarus americanus]|uniref:Uncharacterized protein n=1 Tax=Homarus americanus TaxID=6706 RepID=A0A8J5TGT7_HOMAM|nr:hypothetical protein Hamer_G003299 [Homarus americanus]
MRYMKKIMAGFQTHNPFDSGVPELGSLASGLTATEGDGINRDGTERVGLEMRYCVTIKRSRMVCTLNDLKPGTKVDKQVVVQIDPSVVFMRCTALTQ